jgi:hypothetical protein
MEQQKPYGSGMIDIMMQTNKALDQAEAKRASDAFLARILGMRWLHPLRRGKHSKGRIMKAKNARQFARKKSKIARASRRKNRGK